MVNKNDIVRLEITGFTNEGNGVGRADEMVVFVPFTAVGDIIDCKIVKVKRTYAYGIIHRIITPAKSRIEPVCNVFKKCGGCSFCHVSYDEELKIKEGFVKDSFERIGKLEVDFEPILSCEKTENYRNKAQYPVGEKEGMLVCGFFARRSHRVIDHAGCILQPEFFRDIADFSLEWCGKNHLKAYDEITGKGDVRHIYIRKGEHSGEIMLCLVVTRKNAGDFKAFASEAHEKFPQIKSVVININSKNTNVILGKEWVTLFGSGFITDSMCGRAFRISPSSFYQVNTVQAERLYMIAKEYANLKAGESLLDLYCGVGTIGMCVAKEDTKLLGVEIIPQAIENAKENAKVNGFKNAEYYCGDAGEIADKLLKEGRTPDVIIADPARKGCDGLSLESMVKMSPKRIVMISCNHATAARDCAYLCDHGYEIVRARAVDLFPRTNHVECVVLMTKVQK